MVGAVPQDWTVAVVVVTYQSRRLLGDFVGSLDAGLAGVGAWRLVVADNDSDDGTVDEIGRLAPSAALVGLGANRGYAAGVNAGIKAAGAVDAVLVANPDIRLEPGTVARMVETMIETRAGIVVPRLVDERRHLLTTLRREPTLARVAGEAVLGGGRAGRSPRWGEVVTDPAAYGSRATADWATGALMLISLTCAQTVGTWDESFFLYSEETDYCLRARNAGFPLVYEPDAIAVHLGGESGVSPPLYALLTVNRVRLYRRTHGPVAGAAFWSMLLLGEAVRAAAGRPTSKAAVRGLLRPAAVDPRGR
ncbi:MAG TPA: glycosyltransferase family 2 protein [Actinomycetes bacterium]